MPRPKAMQKRRQGRSKAQRLLEHLKDGRTVTGKQAMRWWGLYRLSSAIHKLRGKGYNIITEMVSRGDVEYARYKLVDTKGE